MSDAQQGLPRYSGRGSFAPVAGALNLHADCIERLDEGLSVHTGSGSYIQGAGGTAIGSPRRQRRTTQNNYGDCKRFALRIAKDTDDTLKLFIGKGGAQVDKPGSTARYDIAATTKTLVEDGIVYLKYNFVTGGTPSLQYGATPSCTVEEMIVRIGQTSKDETTGQWLLPEQWVVTDAFFFVGHGDGVGGEIVTDSDGDPVVDPNGSPVKAFADDYSFRCRVAKDGTTWKVHISAGMVCGNVASSTVSADVITLDPNDGNKTIMLLATYTRDGGSVTTQYSLESAPVYPGGPMVILIAGLETDVIDGHPNVVIIGSSMPGGYYWEDTVTKSYRIASITWSNSVPSLVQHQLGDITSFDVTTRFTLPDV